MNVKIDTKEKFTVITPSEPDISANMTEKLKDLLLEYLNRPIPHVILNMQQVQSADDHVLQEIATIQQEFYARGCSFVICEMNKNIIAQLEAADLFDVMNTTPTESEAWDILQMEEVERELLRDFENNEEL